MPKNEDSQEDLSKKFPSIDFRWECSNCKFLLGFISNNCESVRIKYRDLYVEITGGSVACVCRRCGKTAILTQNAEKKVISPEDMLIRAE